MKLTSLCLVIAFLSCFIFGIAWGGTYPVSLKYSRTIKFPSLQKKLGVILGIAPFRDKRPETNYIGEYVSRRNVSVYFKSAPFPLEKAIQESLSQAISLSGVKTVSISEWNGDTETLKTLEADSILMIDIKRFWIKARTVAFRIKMNASIYFTIHLGVKKEGKVFTQNVFVERNKTIGILTPERMGQRINRILADIFDNFLGNLY